jgi:hypothetical protein
MAYILAFAKRELVRKRPSGGAPAEIIIFPGVRIEYHDLPPAPAGGGAPRRGRRGREKKLASA